MSLENYKPLDPKFEMDYAKFVETLGIQRGQADDKEAPHTDQMSFVLLHMVMGMVTEAAELLDLLKKHMAYDRPLDIKKFKDELSDLGFYHLGAIVEINSCLREIMEINRAKLEARYPNGYSHDRANKRNLDAEAQAMNNVIK